MDPYNNTREQFTRNLVSPPLPSTQDGAKQEWLDLANKLRTLLEKLAHHPAMAENLNQPFMTPAASKNKVYFMWDFVGRTLGMLHGVPPTLPSDKQEQWEDVVGRSDYAGKLLTDLAPGALDKLVEMTYPGQRGNHPEFGDEILALARELYHP